MKKYRKRPVIVHATQITDDTFDAPHPNPDHVVGVIYDPLRRQVRILTLEGEMIGHVGDWLICGIKGEFYPCKNEIFLASYEEAPDAT